MLDYYFHKPTRLRQLRRGLLAPYLDDLAAHLRQQGYRKMVGGQILRYAWQFGQFLTARGVRDVSEINEELGQRFLDEELAPIGGFHGVDNAISHLLGYLRQIGVIAEVEQPYTDDPCAVIVERYTAHLRDVHGLASETCEGYARSAGRFLDFHMERHQGLAFAAIDGPEVLDYVTAWANHSSSQSWTRNLTTFTRAFLRFLRWENLIDRDLDRVVPTIPRWRLSTVPKHLPWEQVREIIDSVNTDSPEGMRDKAILLLLSTLGLRNHDVRTLELGHIDWRESEIRLPKTKSMRARIVPMPQEVGEAIADYIIHARPHNDTPFVFMRHYAPISEFKSPGAVGGIVKKYTKRLKLARVSHQGSHMLRHSLAAKMVNSGSSLKDVADMLGHLHIDTTAIYAKVDTVHLADVALPSVST